MPIAVLSEEKEGTPKCSRRPPNQATSCQLCPTACRPVCLPERQRGISVPAKRSFIPETLVMAAIASIEAYSRLTLSQSVCRDGNVGPHCRVPYWLVGPTCEEGFLWQPNCWHRWWLSSSRSVLPPTCSWSTSE